MLVKGPIIMLGLRDGQLKMMQRIESRGFGQGRKNRRMVVMMMREVEKREVQSRGFINCLQTAPWIINKICQSASHPWVLQPFVPGAKKELCFADLFVKSCAESGSVARLTVLLLLE
jgi:hypothetical protein